MERILIDDQKTTRATIVDLANNRQAATVYQTALTASCYQIKDGDDAPIYIIPSVENR